MSANSLPALLDRASLAARRPLRRAEPWDCPRLRAEAAGRGQRRSSAALALRLRRLGAARFDRAVAEWEKKNAQALEFFKT
jgi:hypothetical protein